LGELVKYEALSRSTRLQPAVVAALHGSVAARKSMVENVDAYIANQSMLQMEDYLKRGRTFESVEDGMGCADKSRPLIS
jgi:hypothetical protein